MEGIIIKRIYRVIFFIIISLSLVTCIDPYTPQLRSFESRLVVDALVTDEATSNYVRLSRTTLLPDDKPAKVTGAVVTITDDLGVSVNLEKRYPGDYRTDSLSFRGETGRTYTLRIETAEGDNYESDPCLMLPVPGIDSLYFGRDQVFSEETGRFREGITFFMLLKTWKGCLSKMSPPASLISVIICQNSYSSADIDICLASKQYWINSLSLSSEAMKCTGFIIKSPICPVIVLSMSIRSEQV